MLLCAIETEHICCSAAAPHSFVAQTTLTFGPCRASNLTAQVEAGFALWLPESFNPVIDKLCLFWLA
jgi:hypothetical protein